MLRNSVITSMICDFFVWVYTKSVDVYGVMTADMT